jgi:hypothetical protein
MPGPTPASGPLPSNASATAEPATTVKGSQRDYDTALPSLRGTGGGGSGEPPVKAKASTAPEYDGRDLFIIASGLDRIGEFGEGVLTSLAPSAGVLPSRGYLVEVVGPLQLDPAARLKFRPQGEPLNAFEGVNVAEFSVPKNTRQILFLVESDSGNRVYPVKAHPCAAGLVIKEIIQPAPEI